jgi:hypothetical protein
VKVWDLETEALVATFTFDAVALVAQSPVLGGSFRRCGGPMGCKRPPHHHSHKGSSGRNQGNAYSPVPIRNWHSNFQGQSAIVNRKSAIPGSGVPSFLGELRYGRRRERHRLDPSTETPDDLASAGRGARDRECQLSESLGPCTGRRPDEHCNCYAVLVQLQLS